MKLYFLRHATAQDIAPNDVARALTDIGKEEARIAGKALAALGAKPGHVLSSPLVRARQTAEIAGRELGFTGAVELVDELKNDASTSALLRALAPKAGDLLLVGHMPSLSEHIAALIGAKDTSDLSLDKAGIACIETDALCPVMAGCRLICLRGGGPVA